MLCPRYAMPCHALSCRATVMARHAIYAIWRNSISYHGIISCFAWLCYALLFYAYSSGRNRTKFFSEWENLPEVNPCTIDCGLHVVNIGNSRCTLQWLIIGSGKLIID